MTTGHSKRAINQALKLEMEIAAARQPARLQEVTIAPEECKSHQLSNAGVDDQYAGSVGTLRTSAETDNGELRGKSRFLK